MEKPFYEPIYTYSNHNILIIYEGLMRHYHQKMNSVGDILEGLVNNKFSDIPLNIIVGVKNMDDLKNDYERYTQLYLEYKGKYEKEQTKREGR